MTPPTRLSAGSPITLPDGLELFMVYAGLVPRGTADVAQIPSMACFCVTHEAWERAGRDMRKLMREEEFQNAEVFNGVAQLKRTYVLVMSVLHDSGRGSPWVSIDVAFFADLWALSSAFRLAEVHGS